MSRIIVIKEQEYQPYFLAYIKKHNLKIGDKTTALDYILWIINKHSKFAKLKNIDTNIIYDEKLEKEFIKFLEEE